MKLLKLAMIPALVASLALIQPMTVQARSHGFGPGLAVGAIVGVIAGAAIASSAQSNNNYYYSSGYYPGPYGPYSCKRVVRVCRDYWGPYGHYVQCERRVRWVC